MTSYPGDYAVPGSAWPGAIVPGTPLTSPALYKFVYASERIYPQWLDVDAAGVTLAALPGSTYVITPANLGAEAAGLGAVPTEPPGAWIVLAQ